MNRVAKSKDRQPNKKKKQKSEREIVFYVDRIWNKRLPTNAYTPKKKEISPLRLPLWVEQKRALPLRRAHFFSLLLRYVFICPLDF